jgi:ferredoxin
VWALNLGAMIESGAIVRFACDGCRRVYDVDLAALAILRGREFSLIGQAARCKASKCRARGMFVASLSAGQPFLCLGERMPDWLVGARPREHEPGVDGPGGGGPGGGGVPPCPKGVDIPGTFRCYNAMFTESKSLGRFQFAQTVGLTKEPAFATQCVQCGKCEQHCPQGLPIREKLKEADKALRPLHYRLAIHFVRAFMYRKPRRARKKIRGRRR